MQTFLPYPDFEKSAQCLDYRRLGKQRVEVLQLLRALATGPEQEYDTTSGPRLRSTPWYNHPACKMWKGYEQALTDYGFAMIREWVDRGYQDTCHDKICDVVSIWSDYWDEGSAAMPPWFGDEKFHAAHRSNLLRKDPIWYGKFGWTEPDNLEYVWSV